MGLIDEEALEDMVKAHVDHRFYRLKSELRNETISELVKHMEVAVTEAIQTKLPALVGKEFLLYKDSGWFETWAGKVLEDELGRVLRNAFKVEITNMVADREPEKMDYPAVADGNG